MRRRAGRPDALGGRPGDAGCGREVFGSGQIEAMDALWPEEAQPHRRAAPAAARRATRPHAVPAARGRWAALWAITGNHPRFFALADLAERVLVDWDPPPELVQVTLEAVALLLVHVGFLRPDGVDELAGDDGAARRRPSSRGPGSIHAVFAPRREPPTDRVEAAPDADRRPRPADRR